MEFLDFKSCLADPDVWMRPAIKSDGNTYYEYILLYVDDALVVSEHTMKRTQEILPPQGGVNRPTNGVPWWQGSQGTT